MDTIYVRRLTKSSGRSWRDEMKNKEIDKVRDIMLNLIHHSISINEAIKEVEEMEDE